VTGSSSGRSVPAFSTTCSRSIATFTTTPRSTRLNRNPVHFGGRFGLMRRPFSERHTPPKPNTAAIHAPPAAVPCSPAYVSLRPVSSSSRSSPAEMMKSSWALSISPMSAAMMELSTKLIDEKFMLLSL
jgi:hypothetical protein